MIDRKCPFVKPPAVHFCQEPGEFPDCHECEIYKTRMGTISKKPYTCWNQSKKITVGRNEEDDTTRS